MREWDEEVVPHNVRSGTVYLLNGTPNMFCVYSALVLWFGVQRRSFWACYMVSEESHELSLLQF